jgi:hypothetical protein
MDPAPASTLWGNPLNLINLTVPPKGFDTEDLQEAKALLAELS